jgi:hypothetical protein
MKAVATNVNFRTVLRDFITIAAVVAAAVAAAVVVVVILLGVFKN